MARDRSRYLDDDPDGDLDEILRRRRKRQSGKTAVVVGSLVLLALLAIVAVGVMAGRLARRDQAKTKPPPATALELIERADPGRPLVLDDDPWEPGGNGRVAVAVLLWVTLGCVWFGMWFGSAVWVIRDARNRDVDSPTVWGLAVLGVGFFTCVGGAVCIALYLATRPARRRREFY